MIILSNKIRSFPKFKIPTDKKIATICNLENMENHQICNGDLITLQLNEGVIYMGQIEDDDAIDKYKYV